MFKKLLGGLGLVLCFCVFASAQNVTVSGAVSGNGTYANLGAAFTAINGGAQTGATIQVSIVGNTTETASATLNAGAWTSVTVAPSGGVRSVTGSVAGPLVDLNGADNVTIDGLNTGGNILSIENQSAAATASTIRLINDATSNTIRNLTLRGASTGTNSGIVLFSTATAGGNDNNTLASSTLDGSGASFPVNAIVSDGTLGQENSGNTVSGNNVSNYFSASLATRGIALIAASDAWTISNNRFFQTGTRSYTTANTHIAVNILSGNGHTVSGNTIGFNSSTGTGTYTMAGPIASRFIAINLAVGTAIATSVQGNTIAAISLGTTSGAATTNGVLCGINVTSGNVNIGTTTGNTIGATTGTGSLAVTSSTSGALVVGINNSSTSTISIQNNTFGAMSSSGTSAGVGGSVTGILNSASAASLTISSNTIGNTTADNMRGGTLGLTTSASNAVGVNVVGLPAVLTVTGNTIRNLSSYGSGGTGFARGIVTGTSTNSAMVANISSNTISTLTSSSFLAGSTSGLIGVGGILLTSGTNCVVSQNVISGLSNINTGTGQYVVAGITHANATNTTISGNRVFGLANAGTGTVASTPPHAAGILVRSGQGILTIVNNMLSVGTGQSTNTAFAGVLLVNTSTPDPIVSNVLLNTINVDGVAGSGANPSFGVARTDFGTTARIVPVNIRGNLIVNARSGGTGSHYAIANNYGATATASGWTSENNVLNANAATVGYWNGALTFAGWKAASLGDSTSFTAVPVTFVNPASDLHLNMGAAPTILESNASPVAGVTADFDGQARPGPAGSVNGGGIQPDFGADEFDGGYTDSAAPIIGLTALGFNCDSNDRVLTATISDGTGVPTTGGFVPRLYFRKNNDPYVSTAGTLTSGTATNGTWSFTLSPALLGGVTTGDTVSYFVIAQDTALTPNIGSNPVFGLVATDVNTVTTPPSSPVSYVVGATLSGTYTVGAGGAFPTLTAAVNAYNGGCLAGPVLFSLIDAAYASETAPIVINSNPYSNPVNRLTIKPAPGVSPLFQMTSTTSLLNLNGADYVTIDGSNGSTQNSLTPLSAASRDLTVQALTATPAAIVWISTTAAGNPATNLTVQNVNVVGIGNLVGLGAGGATIGSSGTNNDNISFVNNAISFVQYGIYSAGASATNKNQNLKINQNLINSGVSQTGIYAAYTNNIEISGNVVGNIASAASGQDPIGINVGYGAVNGIANGNAGIADGASNVVITRNSISGITQSNTFSAAGIALGPTTSGTSLIANNMISGVLSNGTSDDFSAGIVLGGGTAPVNVIHNTVSIYGMLPGATSGTQLATALALNSINAPSALNVSDNILSNTAVGNAGATTLFTAIAYGTSGPFATMVSNNNDLYSAGAGPGTYAVGETGLLINGTVRTTLANWQAAISGDANSVSVAPVFASSTDLHLTAANPQLLGAGQLFAGVDGDFDNDLRDSFPDIGADEIVAGRSGTIPAGVYRDANLATGTIGGDVRVSGVLNLSGIVGTGANRITLDCGGSVAGAGSTSYVVGNVEKSFCSAGSFDFPVGSTPDNTLKLIANPEFTPLTANVTAGTFPSSLTVSVTDGVLPGSSPTNSASRYWSITENGDITADLTFNYLPQDVAGDANTYSVLRRSGVTTTMYSGGSVNAALGQGFAPNVSEFSSWAAGNLIPTAANGTISGRVTTSNGAGIRNAVVTVSGGRLATPIVVRTGTFGIYNVDNLPVGETYVVTVTANRFRFDNPSRVVGLSDSVTDADFVAGGQ